VSLAATPGLELRALLEGLLAGRDLEAAPAELLLERLLDASTPRSLAAAAIAALRAKGESATEIAAFARGLLGRAHLVPRRPGACLDTAGTGGDGTQSFNLSTAAALLLASLGVPVAKHGNRAVSSRAGSADLIEALGLSLPEEPETAASQLARDGFVFLFAPRFHPALAALAPLRSELGVRTIFNLLGPLLNPARPSHQLIGAPSQAAAMRLAEATGALGLERVFVVHGEGFDEATPCGPFWLFVPGPAGVRAMKLGPADFGLEPCQPADLVGGDARANAERLERLFRGHADGPLADAVCLNAALGLLLLEDVRAPRVALTAARRGLRDGRAARLLERLRTGGAA
jgi:anthranilate phosphoribosyltransferase